MQKQEGVLHEPHPDTTTQPQPDSHPMKTRNSHGFIEFSQPAPTPPFNLEDMANRIKPIQARSTAEVSKFAKEDTVLWNILFDLMRGVAGKPGGLRALLKIPDDMNFDMEEIKLAAWVLEVQKRLDIPYKAALDKVLACIRRDPKAHAGITGQDAEFSEVLGDGLCFAEAKGQPANAETIEVFRRARIYRASHPCAPMIEAIGRV